jgi:site-specific DNA recombinase
LVDRNDDGGFTDGIIDRPAPRRLIADIESGKAQCVVVEEAERSSRSLSDVAKLLKIFEQHQFAFVSVTQQLNTTNSMGRLMRNRLSWFAWFEGETNSEQTRDKIAVAWQEGRWSGGMPLLE